MKKLIALCLAMLLCLSVFAACDTGRIIEETTAGKEETTVAGGEETTVAGGEETTVAGGEETTVGGSEDTTAGGSEETTTSGSAYDVEAAKENVKALNNNLLKNPVTGKDFTVTPQVMIAGVAYTVTWTVNTDEVTIDVNAEDNTVTVNINEDALEDLAYVLTATVTAPDGTTAALEFNLTVPKFKFTTFAEYAAAENKAFVTVTGIVTGVFSKATGSQANGLYIQDLNNEGGYYVYNLTDDPNGVILPGMTVVVRGDKDLYNGTYEIINASVQVVDETIKTVEPIDYTEILAGAEKLNDAALVTKQALLVTVKGVTILEVGDNGYYYFQLGEHKVYLRISSSNNATTSEAIANIKAIHAANYGNVADVTGVISIYSGNFYLSPVSADAFSNISVPERTDAEKVALELGGLNLDASASSDKVIDLPVAGTTYDNVTFTWTTADTTGAAVVTDNKLTLTIPDEELVVTITVTAKCGDAEDTKSFEIKLSKTITTIADAIAIGSAKDHNTYTEEKYLVAGIIKEVYNTTYGNMYIVDELGNEFTVYGSYIEGTKYGEFEGAKPVAGDYVVLLGSLGQYSGTAQMKNADIMSFTTPITIPEANELGNTFEKNQYTEDKKVITGEITEVQNTTYGNVVIKDAEGNSILVYGLYSSNGATRYDAMATKPAVGDTITVLGVIGKYNDPQMKNGWLIAHTVASSEEGTVTPPAVEPEDKMTAEEILNALYGLADGEALTGSYTITGTITALDNYNNPTIVVEGFEDKPVYCYKLVVSNAVGDVITVTATSMKNYGGTYEFMNCTLVTEDNGGDNTEDTTTPPAVEDAMTAEEILNALYGLADGEALTGSYTITGTITALDNYNNPTIVVEGFEDKPVYCYKLVVSNAVGDVITVTATSMKNYMGTYEFMNCTLVTADNGGDNTEDTTPDVDASETIDGGVKVVISNYADANGWTNSTLYADLKMNDDITVTVSAETPSSYGQNTGKYYESDFSWRMYQADTTSIVVTAAEGKTIVSVKITYVSNKTGVLLNGTTQVESDAVITVNANSITLGVGNTDTTVTNGQVRITAIEVIYE